MPTPGSHLRPIPSSSRGTNSVAPQTEGDRRQHSTSKTWGPYDPALLFMWIHGLPEGSQPREPRVSFLLSLHYKAHLLYTSKIQACFLPVAAQRAESSAWSCCMTCLSSSIPLVPPSRGCVGCLCLREAGQGPQVLHRVLTSQLPMRTQCTAQRNSETLLEGPHSHWHVFLLPTPTPKPGTCSNFQKTEI